MKHNQLKIGVILSYIQMFLAAVISLLYTPFMLDSLGQSEYGLYNIASSIVSYLSLLNLGFGASYIRFYSKYKAKNDENNISKLNSLFLIIFGILGFVAFVCGIILSQNVKLIFDEGLTQYELNRAKILVIILSFNMAISFPASVFNNYITSQEKFIFQKTIGMLRTVVNPLVMLPVLLMGYKSIGMVVITVVISLITDAIIITYCFKKLGMKFRFDNLDFKVLRDIASFSVFIAINAIIDQINWNVDKLLLGRFRGTVGVAVYGVASQLNLLYLQFSTSISNVFTPKIHKLVEKKCSEQELTELFTKVGRLQFIVLVLIASGLVVFGKPFIYYWAGADYKDSYYITLLLIIPVTIPLIQNLGIEIQRAYNKHKVRSYVYGIMSLFNLSISIPLCIAYGGIGCALGTAISLILANGIFMNIYYHRKNNLNILYFWKNIIKLIPSFILPFAFGYIINRFVDLYNLWLLISFIIIYAVLYGVSVWCLGMNEYEKNLIKRPLNMLKGA